MILLREKGECESQFLGRLIRSPGSLRRRKGSGALKEEIGVWNSQGGGKDKHLFFSTFLSLSHIKCFFKPGIDDHTANILNILNSVLRIK